MAETPLVITLDTRDPLEAQLLVEYLAADEPERFLKACLKLGYITGIESGDTAPRAKTLEELEQSPDP